MAVDQRFGNKLSKNHRREEAPGVRVDPHPYIGVVKNNLDPTRAGRLQVWIPDLGGSSDEPKNWRTVSYASPFMGTTYIPDGKSNTNNSFKNVPHTYGMWMVPPDIGVEVIVIFIAGDPLRGYWIACVNSNLSHHMLPGLASSYDLDLSGADAATKSSAATKKGTRLPVVEFNENDPKTLQKATFYSNPKPIHEHQYAVLKKQGLDRDETRGTISSSSQRETPSNVFGISTPGRPYGNDPADNQEAFQKKLESNTLTEADYAYRTRKGGHTFVMDDGSIAGDDILIRLRTAGGHQIMMHDSDSSLYISHADGSSWIEMTKEGALNVYSATGVNIRTQGSLNLHADKNVNINAGAKMNLKAAGGFQLDTSKLAILSDGAMSLGASKFEINTDGAFNIQSSAISLNATGALVLKGSIKQNSGGEQTVAKPNPLKMNSLSDASQGEALWVSIPGALSTIVTVAPTHEPFDRLTPAPKGEAETAEVTPAAKFTGSNDATKTTAGTGVSNPVPDKFLRTATKCDCKIGNLSSDQMTALLTQIGFSESTCDYSKTAGNYLGKYMFGRLALQAAGYIKSHCDDNAQVHNPNSWTGKDGISSEADWLANHGVQDSAMCETLKSNYNQLVSKGAITKDMPPEDVAGMIMVAHLLGAGGANKWRNGGGGADANGTTGETYFQRGKYAVAVLAPKLKTLDNPIA